MDFVEADAWVWFRHEEEKWLPCRVTTGGTHQLELVDQDGTKYSATGARYSNVDRSRSSDFFVCLGRCGLPANARDELEPCAKYGGSRRFKRGIDPAQFAQPLPMVRAPPVNAHNSAAQNGAFDHAVGTCTLVVSRPRSRCSLSSAQS